MSVEHIWEIQQCKPHFDLSMNLPLPFMLTAAPILVGDNKMRDIMVPVGKDAMFHCDASSLPGESPPSLPKWKKNGEDLVIDGG